MHLMEVYKVSEENKQIVSIYQDIFSKLSFIRPNQQEMKSIKRHMCHIFKNLHLHQNLSSKYQIIHCIMGGIMKYFLDLCVFLRSLSFASPFFENARTLY